MEERLIAQMRLHEERHWWFAARRQVLLALVGAELAEGARLLDVGCGTGFFLEAAAQRYRVSGLDSSPQAVRFCRERGLADVHEGDVESLASLAPGYDAITFFDVIEHLPDDVSALTAARRILQPGGRAFVSVPAYQWLWSHHDGAHGHQRRYTRRSLCERLMVAGFGDVHTGYFNTRLFPAAVAVRGFQRVTGLGLETDLRPPPAPVNRVLASVFSGEARRLARFRSSGYPFGLSVFGVGAA